MCRQYVVERLFDQSIHVVLVLEGGCVLPIRLSARLPVVSKLIQTDVHVFCGLECVCLHMHITLSLTITWGAESIAFTGSISTVHVVNGLTGYPHTGIHSSTA